MLMNINTNQKLIQLLVIDPQQIALWGIQQLVNLDGRYTISSTATNAAEALTMAATCKPDVIILDLMMPGMAGAEVAGAGVMMHVAQARAQLHRYQWRLPVVVLR